MKDDDQIETGHVISLTHWDREWRYPLWTYRHLLVQMMDGLLDLLEREPGYAGYLLDGQTVVVEDYLEIRPENRERLQRLIAGGRIDIGPWYTLPDEFPVDGECLVRNLLKGVRLAEIFGRCMRIGLTNFGWGQTAQLPQIYAGFGIDTLLIGKGVNPDRIPESEFWWRSPDGTTLLASRFGDYGRANFFFNVTLPVLFDRDYLNDWRFEWENGGVPFHRADKAGRWHDYRRLEASTGYSPARVGPGVDAAWHSTRQTLVPSERFLGDGSDLTVPEPLVLRIIEEANTRSGKRRLKHSSLPLYVQALREKLDTSSLRTICGELRDGPPEATSANALAVRPRIKRLNRRAQDMLIRISEPWAVVAWLAGVPYPKAFLDQAWRYLLQAQAHDSINGVTQDRTADDEVWRLNQVVEIGEMVADAALQEITRRADLSRFDPRDVLLLAFNALPFARTEILHAWVDIPTEWEVVDFDVVDPHGAILPLQKISRERRVVPVHQPNSRPWPFHVDRHEIYLGPVEVPSCGYRVFRVSPRRTQPAHVVYWPVPEETSTRSVMVAANQLENEHLRVEVQSDGTLNILNKMTGRLHRGLHYFEDGGDTGDYWVRRKPGHDRVFSTRGLPARVWTEKVGSLRATIVTEIKLRLPKRAEKDADRRSGEETDLTIRSAVTLDRQGPFLSFHTTFTNTAEDHRLRVLFPTDLESQFSDAEGHFTVDRRPVDPTLHPINGLWPEMWTHPQQSFVDLTDGESGFALVNDGLVEYEVLQDSRRTLAVTLLRAVRNEICTEFRVSGSFPEQKGGQSPGEHEFKYGVYFHLGDWRSGQVYQVARRFSVPLQIVQTAAHAGDLPEEASFFNLEPEALVLSALKRAEDRATCIVRLFNPTAQPVNGRLIFHHQVGRAREVTLNEEPGKDLFVAGGKAVQCRVEPGKIFTVEVEFVELHPSL